MSGTERLHALDAIRAFALLGGIVLHAAMSFLPGFGAVGFPITDVSPSATLGLIFFVIHIFRMSLFFLIAGFFGHLLLQRRGVRPFIYDRLKRIGLPLIIGWPILFPLMIAAIIVAVVQLPQPPKPPELPPVPLPFPLSYLWFLYVLLWMYALVLLVRAVFTRLFDRQGNGRVFVDRIVRVLIQSWLGPIVLAIPLCLTLSSLPLWGHWFGIPTPDSSLLPNTPAIIGFFTAFSVGWLVHRQPELLAVWSARWHENLVAALVLTGVAITLVGPLPIYAPLERSWFSLGYAAVYCVAMWYWNFAVLGIGLKFFSSHNERLRYLADSSYWLYLIHLPIVFLAEAIVMRWNLHWTIKFPLILIVTLPLMLLSYRYLVRSTFIGAILNGRRYPRTASVAPVITETSVPASS